VQYVAAGQKATFIRDLVVAVGIVMLVAFRLL
jgi:hypothetical protein